MNKVISLAWGTVLLLFLAACLPQSTLTPVPTVASTPTQIATVLPTLSPEPSQTPLPSPTPTWTLMPTKASTPTPSPMPIPIFGVEMNPISALGGLEQVARTGTYWVRRNNAALWSDMEPREGTRNWDVLAGLENELRDASNKGIHVILIVRSTPPWAQKVAGSYCGPIKAEKLAAFANFMRDLVARYSVPPYSVKYWELWNEPDVDPSLVARTSEFGCWGDQADAYYGGGYYATMLKFVYPQIKAADPQAQVLVGGLVLDCDLINPPAGKDCKPAKFLEGILRNNGGPYFDGVSFHAYDYYHGALGKYGNDNWQSAWNTTGPVSIAKARYLRSLLTQYGQPAKYLMNTETALLCEVSGEEPPCRTKDFENTKTYYLAQSYVTAAAMGLQSNLWYSLFGWRASGLLNPGNQAALPAFEAYRFVTQELRGARFLREVGDYPGVRVYEFERESRRIWALWSLDGAEHSIRLSPAPQAVFDGLGRASKSDNPIRVTLAPLYVEWTK